MLGSVVLLTCLSHWQSFVFQTDLHWSWAHRRRPGKGGQGAQGEGVKHRASGRVATADHHPERHPLRHNL